MGAYQNGRAIQGWACATCGAKFFHCGAPRRSFARFLSHRARRHRQVGWPQPLERRTYMITLVHREKSP